MTRESWFGFVWGCIALSAGWVLIDLLKGRRD
jgi:hypothetical protein